ncbi:MAG: 4-hydroxy-3-methylbut-2-enyl diphosphate reductase [Eubacterium sp.]|nr:4-hydroxy-3-methylbut-2-enyl diphosphate reductase [Eubacterium sp.]
MEVILAKKAGFCFGVQRAIDMVYDEANEQNKNIYTYGPIIHNEEVVSDLESKGVKTINFDEDELNNLSDCTIVIRSHGVAKSIYDDLESKNVSVIDATCPFVKKIHEIVQKESEEGKSIIIVGSEYHPEVQGIKGWVKGDAYIVDEEADARGLDIDIDKPVCIVSQTTYNPEKFSKLVEIIREKGYYSNVVNTICNATHERQLEAKEIAKKVDAMIVIGGKNSSNTQKLYEICKGECENTFYIQTAKDLNFEQIKGYDKVGITAGASTPKNIIEEVHAECQK